MYTEPVCARRLEIYPFHIKNTFQMYRQYKYIKMYRQYLFTLNVHF